MTKKPTFDRKRPLSWSAISSFEYDPEQWYQCYVMGIRPTSKEMTFGSMIDKKIQEDPTFLPELPRYPLMQYKLETMFNKIPLIGYPDGLDIESLSPKKLSDYKTGKKAWDQKRADETGQLTMYLWLIYLIHGIHPDNFTCYIHWLPTQDNGDFSISLVQPVNIQTFETRRTMMDLLHFGKRINQVYKAMDEYAKQHA